jgi:hypothetical protein
MNEENSSAILLHVKAFTDVDERGLHLPQGHFKQLDVQVQAYMAKWGA